MAAGHRSGDFIAGMVRSWRGWRQASAQRACSMLQSQHDCHNLKSKFDFLEIQ
jgi:hypothetical protein